MEKIDLDISFLMAKSDIKAQNRPLGAPESDEPTLMRYNIYKKFYDDYRAKLEAIDGILYEWAQEFETLCTQCEPATAYKHGLISIFRLLHEKLGADEKAREKIETCMYLVENPDYRALQEAKKEVSQNIKLLKKEIKAKSPKPLI